MLFDGLGITIQPVNWGPKLTTGTGTMTGDDQTKDGVVQRHDTVDPDPARPHPRPRQWDRSGRRAAERPAVE